MSKAEQTRYDRQVRLWGKTTQQRVMHTHVVLRGVAGEAAEVAKNLVLAGVRALSVDDPSPVSVHDLANNLLVQGAGGGPREQLAVAALQKLNPHVRVTCTSLEDTDVLSAPAEDGAIQVVMTQASTVTDCRAALVPHANIQVITAACGDVVLALFLFSKLRSACCEAQLHSLLCDAATLRTRPAAYQRCALLLHLQQVNTEKNGVRRSFMEWLRIAAELVEQLQLGELGAEDVEAVIAALGVQQPVHSCMSAVSSTLAGASIAQHLVRQIGASDEAADEETYGWMLCDPNALEVMVGV